MNRLLRILVTGSRTWTDGRTIERAILRAIDELLADNDWLTQSSDIVIVHGASVDKDGNPVGADWLADRFADRWGYTPERHPACDFPHPKARNLHMVAQGAHRCCSFAKSWASGTGNCARAARKAGIHTVDFGVSTRMEDRP